MSRAELSPIHADLELAGSRYVQLAARVPKTRQSDTTHASVPGGSVPIDTAIVDHMLSIEQFIPWWAHTAGWLLDPQPKIDLTRREHLVCPTCGTGTLVAWPRSEVIRCLRCGASWNGGHEWRRLGVVLGVYDDGRFGARLPDVTPTSETG